MQCDRKTCKNRLLEEFSSDNLSRSPASEIFLPEPHHNANMETSRADYAHLPSYTADTCYMDRVSLGAIQRIPTPYTVNNSNGARISDFDQPPPGEVPMWPGSPTDFSQYQAHFLENRISSPTQRTMTQLQSYGYPVSQMSYGGPITPMMLHNSPDDFYNHNYSAPGTGQIPWACTHTPMVAHQPSSSYHTTTAAPGDFGHNPTATISFGYNNFQNSVQNNLDNNTRSLDEKTSKSTKGSLRAKVRIIFKLVSSIYSPKHRSHMEGKPLVLTAS
jgi:hypothetical protein